MLNQWRGSQRCRTSEAAKEGTDLHDNHPRAVMRHAGFWREEGGAKMQNSRGKLALVIEL